MYISIISHLQNTRGYNIGCWSDQRIAIPLWNARIRALCIAGDALGFSSYFFHRQCRCIGLPQKGDDGQDQQRVIYTKNGKQNTHYDQINQVFQTYGEL